MQEERKIRISMSELLYLGFLVIMLFAKGIGLYDGQMLYKLFLVVAMAFVGAKMCITKYTLKEWIILISTFLLVSIVYLNCKEKGIVIYTLVILGMKDVSLDRVFKVGMWTWGITMLGNIMYHLINMDSSGYKVHEKLGLGHIFRWDLGFSHPNVLHISYLVLAAFIVYNLDKKYNWKCMFLLMLGNVFIFIYSVSYTGILVTSIYLFAAWYVNIRGNFSKWEYGLLELVFPLCLLLSMFSPVLLPDSVFQIANKIFSNRLILAKYYLVPENIKLFGNNMEKITTSIYTMDNAYVFAFVIYGIVIYAVMVCLYLFLIHRYVKEKKNKELVIIVCFLIAGISEPFLFNTSFKNLTFFFIGNIVWRREKNKNAYALFPKKNRILEKNLFVLSEWKEKIICVWKVRYKKIVFYSVCIAVVTGCLYGINKKMPEGYIVPRKQVDIESDETWYLNSPEDVEYEGMKVMDYTDPNTKMQILQGNIVIVERIRTGISAICVIWSAIGVLLTLYYVCRQHQMSDKQGID